MAYPKVLADLIYEFRKLPGIGEKSAERYALAVLDFKHEDVEKFASSIKISKETLHRCSICGEWEYSDTEPKFCPNCGVRMERRET